MCLWIHTITESVEADNHDAFTRVRRSIALPALWLRERVNSGRQEDYFKSFLFDFQYISVSPTTTTTKKEKYSIPRKRVAGKGERIFLVIAWEIEGE